MNEVYIFDLDGTLTDSNGLWIEVDDEFLARRGLQTTPEYQEMVSRAIFPTAAEYTRSYYHLEDDPQAIMAEWEELARHHYAHLVPLKPGALELLEQTKAAGIPMILFTACRPALCRTVVERFGLDRYFRQIIFAEELGLEKHDPRCFTRLSQLIGAPPEACTLFDDSPSVCATARKAGMTSVGVCDRFYAHLREELKTSASRWVESLEDCLN